MRELGFVRGERRAWRSVQAIAWHVGRKGSGDVVMIPEGREFESSVPVWMRWVISPDDPRFLLAALVHDYMLEEGIYGRPQAAAEWLDAALAGGAPPFRTRVFFVAVAAWAVMWPDRERVPLQA